MIHLTKLQGDGQMIEIMKFELINKGPLVARFTCKMLKWGCLNIRECTLFDTGTKRWVNLPSRQYDDAEGKKKYYPYLAYEERNLDDKFKEMIIKAVDEYIARNVSESKPEAQEAQGSFPF